MRLRGIQRTTGPSLAPSLLLLLTLSACHGGGTTEITPVTAAAPAAPDETEPPGSESAAEPGAADSSPAPAPRDDDASSEPRPSEPLASPRRAPPSRAPALSLRQIAPEQICTTLGTVRSMGAGLRVDDTKLRATLAGSRGHGIELAFRYLGPSAVTSPLRSGSERRQLGVELAARDTCNLLYVMWRIEPTSELVVQVKRNDTESTHAECENRGYHRLRPARSTPVPELTPGASHRLRAEISEGALQVLVDGVLVWSGPLDSDALELEGKSGLRSDNARFELLEVLADPREDDRASCPG